MPVRAQIAASKPAVVGTSRIGTEVKSGVDSPLASSREGEDRRGPPGALGHTSAPGSQASQSGLWISPVKGLGALERWRRGLPSLRGVWGVALGGSGHQTWIMRQINTRATNRSW